MSQPDKMRKVARQAIAAEGVEMPIGKRKKGRAQKFKVIEWSEGLSSVIKEALALQRPRVCMFSATAKDSPTRRAAGTPTCAG